MLLKTIVNFIFIVYFIFDGKLSYIETVWGKGISGKITSGASETPILLLVSVI